MIEQLDPEHDLVYSVDDEINYGTGYYIEKLDGTKSISYANRSEILSDFIKGIIEWEKE